MRTWAEITAANPEHSENYAQRWRSIAASGEDIYGEARLVDAMVDRHARILDAGCGTGRVGGWLAARGHRVAGTDLDPVLVGYAKQDYPDVAWEVADLATDSLPAGEYDAVVCAGNVLWFIAPGDRRAVLRNLRGALASAGRLLVGFGAGRGYEFDDFFQDAEAAGLSREHTFSSWDLRPFNADSSYLVAVFTADSAEEEPADPATAAANNRELSLSHGLVKKLSFMDAGGEVGRGCP